MAQLTVLQHQLNHYVWVVIKDMIEKGATWDDVILVMKHVQWTAESNKEFGLRDGSKT